MVFEFGICRKRSRSKARPSKGDKTTTETTKAGNPDQCSFWVRMVKTNAAGEGLGAEGEVEDAGGLIGQDEADRHDGVGAPVGDPREGETEKLLHAGR